MKPADWILLALMALFAVLALRAVRRRKGGCACGCTDCPHANACRRMEYDAYRPKQN